MEIHRNKEWTSPITVSTGSATAASVDASKAQVVFDETLHVRTWIDGGNCITNDFIQVVVILIWKMPVNCSGLHQDRDREVLGVQQFGQ